MLSLTPSEDDHAANADAGSITAVRITPGRAPRAQIVLSCILRRRTGSPIRGETLDIVLERDGNGRGTVVAYEVDARIKTVRFRLRQAYDEPHRLGSEYLGGDFRDFSGEWRCHALAGGRTRAELDLHIDPGRLVPARLRSVIAEAVVGRALRDLKTHVEKLARG